VKEMANKTRTHVNRVVKGMMREMTNNLHLLRTAQLVIYTYPIKFAWYSLSAKLIMESETMWVLFRCILHHQLCLYCHYWNHWLTGIFKTPWIFCIIAALL